MCGFLTVTMQENVFYNLPLPLLAVLELKILAQSAIYKIKHTENCTQTVFNDTKTKMHLFHYKIIQFCNGELAFEKDMQISLLRLSSLPT